MTKEPKEIEDLAAKGRRVRAEVAARADAKKTAAAKEERTKEQAEDHKRLWQSVSLFGMRGREIGEWYFVILAMIAVAVAFGYVFYKLSPSWGYIHFMMGRDRTPFPIISLVMAGLVLAWVIHQTIFPLPRERAWIASLPFRVRGYELTLSSYRGDNDSKLELVFEWIGDKPEQQALLDLLAVDGVAWHGFSANRVSRVGIKSSDSDHNRELRAWWRKLVTERLVALHRNHPFSTVTLLNDRGRALEKGPHTPVIPA